MAEPRPLTRDVLAKFLPDQESIRRFEKLFLVVSELTPAQIATLTRLVQEASIDANTAQASAQSALDQLGQIVQDATINAGAADSKSTQALDLLSRIAQSLELLAGSPPIREDNFIGTDYIDVSTVAPIAVGGVPGRLKWNDTDGTLDLGLKGGNVTLQVGQENVLLVKNDESTPLVDGEVVYVSGASGANLLVKRALADSDVTSASTIGVVTEQIAVNGQGFITTFGSVRGLNTNSFNEGDILYLSPTTPGAIVNVKPVAPQHMVTVGYCTKKSGGNGEIFVKVDNGYEVDELHNVLITNPVLAGSLLVYDATVGVWKNALLTAGTNVTITNADGSITIAVSGAAPTGLAGGVLSGTYPNPGFAVDMATQAELDAHTGSNTVHGATGAVVGTTNTQTLTNKTLTAAVLGGTTDLSGGQIKFPATQVASSDPNTLDDYEEGTWTATLKGFTTAGTYQLLNNDNYYTKIGNRVFVQCRVSLDSVTGGGAGFAVISGLPFTKRSASMAVGSLWHINVDYPVAAINGSPCVAFYTFGSSSEVYFPLNVSGGGSEIAITGFSSFDYINFSIDYEVS